MFEKIEIERFRGIKSGKIEGLKQLNLFFGKNNCGKSSILDSIFLITGLSNPILPLNINFLRDYRRFDRQDVILDFYALDATMPIVLKAYNNELRELSISLMESSNAEVDLLAEGNNIASTSAPNSYGLSLECKINGAAYESSILFNASKENQAPPSIMSDPGYKENLKCRYMNPKFDFYTSIDGLVNVIQNKEERFIIDALKLIEPRLVDFVLSQNEVLVDIGIEKRIPINMMGDGARKILSLLTTIYECRNGIMLVDEISNGFHYSVMKDVWKCIMSAAKRNNVQIFATTHDKDSIIGLRDAVFASEDEESVACFKLQHLQDDSLQVYHYSLASVDYSINQEIEIR